MKRSQIKIYLTRFPVLDIFLSVLVLYILLPRHMFFYPFNGLDQSWILAVNMAINENLVFGKDFIFTVGPLGYLWTGLFIDVPIISIVLFHILLFLSLFFIFQFYFKSLKKPLYKAIFAIGIMITSSNFYFEKSLVLLFIFLFSIFLYLENKRKIYLFYGGFIALLSFFIKLNTGIVIIGFLMGFLAVLVIFKHERISFILIYILLFLIVLFSFGFVLNTDIFNYIANSILIILDYNESSSVPAAWNILLLAVTIWSIYFLTILLDIKLLIKNPKNLIVVGFVSASLFIIFKEAFVRADGHMMLFFSNIFLFSSLIFLFGSTKKVKKYWGYSLLLFSIISIVAFQSYYPAWGPINSFKTKLSSIPYQDLPINKHTKKLEEAINYSSAFSKLPISIQNKLKGKTADIIPWDVSYLYFNNIKYNPRPIIHSYLAGSKKLDQLNAQKYTSSNAPDYIFFALGSIDQRNPFWDETQTKINLLTHYEIDDTLSISKTDPFAAAHRDFLFLKKRHKTQKLKEINEQKIDYTIGDILKIPKSNNLLYLYADIEYTTYGKIKKLLFQPNILYAEIKYSGVPYPIKYRAVIPVLKGGILINKRIINFDDTYQFFQSNGKTNAQIEYIIFLPENSELKPNISIVLKEFIVE